MGLKGVKVNGQAYHFDHEYLDNNPIPAYGCATTIGQVLSVNDNNGYNELEWRDVIPTTDCGNWGFVLVSSSEGPHWESSRDFLGIEFASPGNVLTVAEGYNGSKYLSWESVGSGGSSSLPTYDTTYPSNDEGKVLTVNDCGDLEWRGSGSGDGLPPCDADDAGKALLVGNNGSLEWGRAIPVTECFMSDTFGIMTVTGDIENMEWAPVSEDLLGFPPIENIINRAVLVAYDDDDFGTHMSWTELDEYLLLDMLPSFGPGDDGKVLMTNGYSVFWDNPS